MAQNTRIPDIFGNSLVTGPILQKGTQRDTGAIKEQNLKRRGKEDAEEI
jgi:hypothetical protein